MATRPVRRPQRDAQSAGEPSDDTVRRCLTKEERARLVMDAWEPSLLRNLLSASDRLKDKREG